MSKRENHQFIYLFDPIRPELVTDPDSWTEKENRTAENHVAYLRKATDEGVVLLAGRSLDGEGPALVILDATSAEEAAAAEEARRFMENDPFVADGLFRAHLHPYRAAMVRAGYPSGEALGQSFGVNGQVIRMQADGLTHAESLLQLPFRGNCFNWVAGHILANRNRVVDLLGEVPFWGEEEISRYARGSEPIASEGQALPLERLLKDLERSQELIEAGLARVTPQEMAAGPAGGGQDPTLGELLVGLHWHETYHVGQLEILRQLAGKDDAVIA
jgi:uncharacterized protein YciI